MVEYNKQKDRWKWRVLHYKVGVIYMSSKFSMDINDGNWKILNKSFLDNLEERLIVIHQINILKQKLASALQSIYVFYPDKTMTKVISDNFFNYSINIFSNISNDILSSQNPSLDFAVLHKIVKSLEKMLEIMVNDYENADEHDKLSCAENLIEWITDSAVNINLKFQQFGFKNYFNAQSIEITAQENKEVEGRNAVNCVLDCFAA